MIIINLVHDFGNTHAFKTTDNDFKYTRIWGYRHVQPGTVRFVIQSNDLEDKNKT